MLRQHCYFHIFQAQAASHCHAGLPLLLEVAQVVAVVLLTTLPFQNQVVSVAVAEGDGEARTARLVKLELAGV